MGDKRDGLVAEEFDDATSFEMDTVEEVVEDTATDSSDMNETTEVYEDGDDDDADDVNNDSAVEDIAADAETAGEVAPPTPEQIIEDLRAEITRLSEARAASPAAYAESAGPAEVNLDTLDVTEGYDFDEVLTDPTVFSKCVKDAVTKVLQAHMDNIQVGAIEKMQTVIPNIVASQVTHQQTQTQAAERFYNEHQPLAQHKPLVASHVTSVASEHPDWGLEQIMAEAAARSYAQLRLTATATTVHRDTAQKPGAGLRRPGKTGRVSSQPSVNSLQSELDELDGIQAISQF